MQAGGNDFNSLALALAVAFTQRETRSAVTAVKCKLAEVISRAEHLSLYVPRLQRKGGGSAPRRRRGGGSMDGLLTIFDRYSNDFERILGPVLGPKL